MGIFTRQSFLSLLTVYYAAVIFSLILKILNLNISNTRKSVLSGFPNTERCVEKGRRSRVIFVILTNFEVLGYLMTKDLFRLFGIDFQTDQTKEQNCHKIYVN